ncbi:MAG: hypothetical protein RIB59_00825 [Rhodospirillales bacterium]
MRTAAAVFGLGAEATSPRAKIFSYLGWRMVAGSTANQPAESASGLCRTKSGAHCGGTTWIMSNDLSSRRIEPSFCVTSNQAFVPAPPPTMTMS